MTSEDKVRLLHIREPLRTLLEFCTDPQWIATAAIGLAILFGLTGCAATQMRSVTGQEVDAPAGFVIYCQTHPARIECGGGQ